MVSCPQFGFDLERRERTTMESYGFLSILPPLVAVALAWRFKNVLASLLAGCFTGTLILFRGNPMTAVVDLIRNTIFVQAASEQREERGLACPVAPDQPDPLAWIDRHRRAIEQHLGPAPQGDVLEGDHEKTLRQLTTKGTKTSFIGFLRALRVLRG